MAAPTEPPATPMHAPRPPLIVLVLTGPIARGNISALADRVESLLRRCDADLVVCDVSALPAHDAVTVEALCRLQLIARRLGRRVEVLGDSVELRELIAYTGLSGVAPPCEELVLEPRGQAKEREPASGVEEEGDTADPVA